MKAFYCCCILLVIGLEAFAQQYRLAAVVTVDTLSDIAGYHFFLQATQITSQSTNKHSCAAKPILKFYGDNLRP